MTIPSGLDMFEDIEVWIVVDDYVSYSINDKELTLTFKENLDVDLGQYFGHKKVKFLSNLSCKLLTFFWC